MKKLSDILRERRESSGYSRDDIEKEIKIKKEFITAIEDGRYKDLPSDTYAAGFVKNYARFLGMQESKAMALFRRDYKTGKSEFVPTYRKKRYTRTKSFLFSLKGGVFLFAAAAILIYLVFQLSSLFVGPKLMVTSPEKGSAIEQKVVEVKGETDPYATLLINGEETYVALDGSFKKSLYVFGGNQKITVVAKNRFGKATVEEITVSVRE